ncbi:MAG: hypothetical protein JSW26_15560 [Desulfobacterales bacterium]|nr:MAG: hypothetical protein JSW26_15560 [Desulfobacterales bacterium]
MNIEHPTSNHALAWSNEWVLSILNKDLATRGASACAARADSSFIHQSTKILKHEKIKQRNFIDLARFGH